MHEPDSTFRISRLLINLIYDEILNQFLHMNGKCKESTFNLLKIIDNEDILDSRAFF